MRKYRFLILTALIVGGFVYLTSVSRWPRRWVANVSDAGGNLWSEPVVARTASLSTDEINNIEIYKMAHAATVNITSTVYRRGWFMQIVPDPSTGSGFVIRDDGLILTNYHVVSGRAPEIQVTMPDKSRYKASILARDYPNDLALIRIAPRKKIDFLRLGDSDHLQVGQKVLAIGNPFGLEGTLTTGIVSSIGRTIADQNGRELEGMIQTDAAINPGNSGGPLLDSFGNVVGINTAIYGPGGNIGIGFAMPISRAKSMIERYQAGGSFARPRLGVSTVYVAGDLAQMLNLPSEGGLLVQEVGPGSPAASAGIRDPRQWVIVGNLEIGVGGDLITEVDGRPVDTDDAVRRALDKKHAGDTLELTVFRDGRSRKITVTLGAASEENF
ncbi:MAG: trypsin-like peptidase domain-containing protein [Bryobacterales bacterium]|nr:trypsin-like peptidase domain-containing protein [Bryobacterales bacterium]